MEIIKTITTREGSSWPEIAQAIRAGSIKEIIGVGDRLTVSHSEYGLLEFDVLDFDRDMPAGRAPCSTVTLQLHDLVLPEMPFDHNGKTSWERSTIRARLNSREFMEGFDPEFVSLITSVSKITNQGTQKEEHTKDFFFLLSLEETDEASCYTYYNDKRSLTKFDADGNSDWWWLRSAKRGTAYFTWYVTSSGYVNSYHACGATRCAPACVIC